MSVKKFNIEMVFWKREKNAFCSLPGYPQQQPSFLKNKKIIVT
jgi:hypothetical protein